MTEKSEADRLADKVEDLIAEFGSDPTAALQCVSEWLELRRHEQSRALSVPAPSGGGVEKLSWTVFGEGEKWARSVAVTPFGKYSAWQNGMTYFEGAHVAACLTEEEAKASAQADYEHRILSAITTKPDEDRMRERVAELEKALEPFAHIGGSLSLVESLPRAKTILAKDGDRRLFAIGWSCFLAARAALANTSEAP